jgi:hypothetical protein
MKSNYLLIFLAFLLGTIFACLGCSNAGYSRLTASGQDHTIELYSGGEKIRTWTSSGKVYCEEQSDGYYFQDSETKQLVRVSGTLIIYPKKDSNNESQHHLRSTPGK